VAGAKNRRKYREQATNIGNRHACSLLFSIADIKKSCKLFSNIFYIDYEL